MRSSTAAGPPCALVQRLTTQAACKYGRSTPPAVAARQSKSMIGVACSYGSRHRSPSEEGFR